MMRARPKGPPSQSQKAFLWCFSLQAGVILYTATIFVVRVTALLYNVTASNHYSSGVQLTLSYMILLLFTILSVVSLIFVSTGAFLFQARVTKFGNCCLLITECAWLFLSIMGFIPQSRAFMYVCVDDRCPSTQWIFDEGYRWDIHDCDLTTTERHATSQDSSERGHRGKDHDTVNETTFSPSQELRTNATTPSDVATATHNATMPAAINVTRPKQPRMTEVHRRFWHRKNHFKPTPRRISRKKWNSYQRKKVPISSGHQTHSGYRLLERGKMLLTKQLGTDQITYTLKDVIPAEEDISPWTERGGTNRNNNSFPEVYRPLEASDELTKPIKTEQNKYSPTPKFSRPLEEDISLPSAKATGKFVDRTYSRIQKPATKTPTIEVSDLRPLGRKQLEDGNHQDSAENHGPGQDQARTMSDKSITDENHQNPAKQGPTHGSTHSLIFASKKTMTDQNEGQKKPVIPAEEDISPWTEGREQNQHSFPEVYRHLEESGELTKAIKSEQNEYSPTPTFSRHLEEDISLPSTKASTKFIDRKYSRSQKPATKTPTIEVSDLRLLGEKELEDGNHQGSAENHGPGQDQASTMQDKSITDENHQNPAKQGPAGGSTHSLIFASKKMMTDQTDGQKKPAATKYGNVLQMNNIKGNVSTIAPLWGFSKFMYTDLPNLICYLYPSVCKPKPTNRTKRSANYEPEIWTVTTQETGLVAERQDLAHFDLLASHEMSRYASKRLEPESIIGPINTGQGLPGSQKPPIIFKSEVNDEIYVGDKCKHFVFNFLWPLTFMVLWIVFIIYGQYTVTMFERFLDVHHAKTEEK